MPVVKESEVNIFNPVVDRHLGRYWRGLDVAYRDISKGDEDNYLFLHTDPGSWEGYIQDLRSWCSGEAGTAVQLERRKEQL